MTAASASSPPSPPPPLLLVAAALLLAPPAALLPWQHCAVEALDNGVGLRPQLGFNSWNAWGCEVNETLMRATIDAFVSTGLKDVGFEYVSMDDCWQSGCRVGDPKFPDCTALNQLGRHPNGTVIPNRTKFGAGVKSLADYAHAKGLKFGLYSSNSPKTCGGHAGSQGYEDVDARTYSEWGVDLLKYDNCAQEAVNGPPERGYSIMRDALNATGRPILFSACEWAVDFPATWMGSVANSWRTTYDIQNHWECVVSHVDWTNVYADFARPGAFNDMDILEVGNVGDPWAPSPERMSQEEWRSHFSLWAVMKAPLMIGCDLATPLCQSALPLFLNKEMIAINQDELGVQAKRVRSHDLLPITKSGICRSEELPQNTIIAPCDANDPLQRWSLHANGTIGMGATGECLTADSGQGGDCGGANGTTCTKEGAGSWWKIWSNNAASAMCNDPTGCCGAREQLWTMTSNHTLLNELAQQCLTVHAEGMHNVGVNPCSPELAGLQVWDFQPSPTTFNPEDAKENADSRSGQFVSSVMLPSGGRRSAYGAGSGGVGGGSGDMVKSCLARTPDVRPGATEVYGGPLANGDYVVLFFNRNVSTPATVEVEWADLGIPAGKTLKARDLWAQKDLPGTYKGSCRVADVPVHGVRVLRLSPVAS